MTEAQMNKVSHLRSCGYELITPERKDSSRDIRMERQGAAVFVMPGGHVSRDPAGSRVLKWNEYV